MPGEFETFGLVAFEAAGSGASVVACETAPSARVIGALGERFAPGDVDGLLAAIERARAARTRPSGRRALRHREPLGERLRGRTRRPRGAGGDVTCRRLAVSIHDVEPASFSRCALIRDWLDDFGVEKVTLLVIPAPQLHPFTSRSPELVNWLLDRRDAGDAIAQHGLQHRRTRPAPRFQRPLRSWQGGTAAEYPGLDAESTIASVEAGRRVLTDAGVEPRGFVAPGYAYTGALKEHLAQRFDWWATLFSLRGHAHAHAPALVLGTGDAFKRATSPMVVRAGASVSGQLLRLDLHPADFDHPRHVLAVERVLRRAHDRVAVTYDDLC